MTSLPGTEKSSTIFYSAGLLAFTRTRRRGCMSRCRVGQTWGWRWWWVCCRSWPIRSGYSWSSSSSEACNIRDYALQRTNTENRKQIFPEKELRGHCPNVHIHVSMSDSYIPRIDLPILLQGICGLILGIYKLLTDTWMWKLGLRPRNSQKRNT